MKRFAPVFGALALVLAGCASPGSDIGNDSAAGAHADFINAHDLVGMDSAEIIDHLDRLGGTDRPTDFTASVRPDELVLSNGQQETAMDLPEDRFYLALAPYLDQTHECFYHSPTTCQGELIGQDLDVQIADHEGAVILDEEMTTFDNGFIGIWLPRNMRGTIDVKYNGRTGTTDFTTTSDAATCLTALQLT